MTIERPTEDVQRTSESLLRCAESLTRKQCKALGATISRRPIDEGRPRVGSFIAITAPDGKRFSTGESELLCDDWHEARGRTEFAKLVDDDS